MSPEALDESGSAVGDDVVCAPEPLTEEPPADRFCDLVLTGGVASGVVYPWAVLELARHYRFKSIGGTSVGAMAAALAAAAEYGRRTGWPQAFEVLRRVPGKLAEPVDGRTRLFSLFQPSARGKRLFALFTYAVERKEDPKVRHDNSAADPRRQVGDRGKSPGVWSVALRAARLYLLAPLGWAVLFSMVLALVAVVLHDRHPGGGGWWTLGVVIGLLLALIAALAWAAGQAWRDLREGLIDNDLGLCRGGPSGNAAADLERPALVAWMHEGIQRAAGLAPNDLPLTFRDLWSAPAHPGARRVPADEGTAPDARSIDLQMITTNVTLGRPVRLPLQESSTRLFFQREQLAAFLPPEVMRGVMAVAQPYQAKLGRDPPASARTEGYYELPRADLPIVVAARLSLSFPLLFSAVPLWAVDYEHPRKPLERCWFSDGGLCSNFPVHLFDSAIPRWPTFGMWFADRDPQRSGAAVWLPHRRDSGYGEMRRRFDSKDSGRWPGAKPITPRGFLVGFLVALGLTAKDWGDYTRLRMPHVRNRVARLALFGGEGGLNIAMSRRALLEMAAEYGTRAGQAFVSRYGQQPDGQPGPQWSEQRWVRVQTLVKGLRELIRDIPGAQAESAYTRPLDELIARARGSAAGTLAEGTGPASPQEAGDYTQVLEQLAKLDACLAQEMAGPPYDSEPPLELRLRPTL
jgi:hypothetical protein